MNYSSEKKELDSLIEKGMEFKIGKRTFLLKEPYLGTLDRLSHCFIDMQLDEKAMQDDPLKESKALPSRTVKQCAKVVAIAVLRSRAKMWLVPIISKWFEWNVKPSTLLQLALIINQMCNFADFTNAIRLMSAARTTAPTRIAESEQD